MDWRRRSSATNPMPARIASAGERGANGLPSITHFAAGAGAQAEERLDRLRAPGADQAAEAENLAAMQIE